MKISIVIPVYNVREYLSGCMASVLANDLSDCEIILVDDGATDDSGTLCDEFAAAHPDRIRVIHQENGGLGAARNTGLEAAEGEYLLFLDSDDSLAPGALEEMLALDLQGADLCVFDPNEAWTIDPEDFASMGRATPFAGTQVQGKVKMTVCDGEIVYQCGE